MAGEEWGENEKDWVEKCRKRKWQLFFVQSFNSPANGGLRSVREALLFAYGTNVIDSVEFAVFYDANSETLYGYFRRNRRRDDRY